MSGENKLRCVLEMPLILPYCSCELSPKSLSWSPPSGAAYGRVVKEELGIIIKVTRKNKAILLLFECYPSKHLPVAIQACIYSAILLKLNTEESYLTPVIYIQNTAICI